MYKYYEKYNIKTYSLFCLLSNVIIFKWFVKSNCQKKTDKNSDFIQKKLFQIKSLGSNSIEKSYRYKIANQNESK